MSLFLLKSSVEDQLQRLADALTLSLRSSVLENFKAVDAFLGESMEKLGARPRTIEDISTVRALNRRAMSYKYSLCCRTLSCVCFCGRAKRSPCLTKYVLVFSTLLVLHAKAKRDWKEIDSKKDEIRSLSKKCVGLKALLLQHAPGNQVSVVQINMIMFVNPHVGANNSTNVLSEKKAAEVVVAGWVTVHFRI